MDRERQGGWVDIMASRYRGTMYVGVTAELSARVEQHRSGTGSDFCAKYGTCAARMGENGDDITACITQEKRIKRWRRDWVNPDWRDLYDDLVRRRSWTPAQGRGNEKDVSVN